MFLRVTGALALLAASTPALAASDLVPSISGPTGGAYVYATGRYTVTVSNTGNQNASSSTVVVQLPETNTSPSVYVMGTVGAKSASCTTSGTTLVCTLGTILKKKSTSIWFDYAIPETSDTVEISATAATTSSENSTTNNTASHTPSLTNYTVSFTAPVTLSNDHCTGTGLTSYYECSLFPSSISTHESILEDDGSVSFTSPDADGYSGSWWSDGGTHLAFEYYDPFGAVAAEFVGYGVSATCWEGVTTFPGSTYVSPYRVCIQ